MNIIDTEIANAPEYEWYPRTTLTAEQIRAMELRQVDCVNQATEVYEACRRILSRRKEATDREVISRVTNEEQEKELAKAVREIERKNWPKQKVYLLLISPYNNTYLYYINNNIIADAKRKEKDAKKEAKDVEAHQKATAEQKAAAKQEKIVQKMSAKKPTKNATPNSREQITNQPKESVDDDDQVQSSIIRAFTSMINKK